MARKVAPILLLFAYGTCMEMKETVERMVMVRTTGSDLQPAATGFIYKKESNGPESVVKMGETEVMEHLSKLYKPEAYKAPLPAAKGPFHDEDESKAASHASEIIIPVVEKTDEENEHIDGIANEDYGKIFGYGSDDDYKGFSDYFHGLGHFDHGLYEHGGGKDYGSKGHHEHGDKGYKGYAKSHKYGKGGAGDYHTEKYESFSVSGGGGQECKKHYDEADVQGKDYEQGHKYNGGDHGHKSTQSKGQDTVGYHKIFDKDDFKKDHDFYDAEKQNGDFYKYGNRHVGHGSDAGGYKKGSSHESGHDESNFGKEGFVEDGSEDEHESAHSGNSEEESSSHHHGDFGSKRGHHKGNGFGYEVKH